MIRLLRRLSLWLGLVESVDDRAEQVIEAMRQHPSYPRAHDLSCQCEPCLHYWELVYQQSADDDFAELHTLPGRLEDQR